MSTMKGILDFEDHKFKEYLAKVNEMVVKVYSNLDHKHGFSGVTPNQIREMFDEPLPEAGQDFESVLNIVQEKVYATATMNIGPYMYAYVMSGGCPVSFMGDILSSAINQNVGKWHLAPAMTELEKRICKWTNEFLTLDQTRVGVLVSGGSAANQMGLNIARNIFFESYDIRNKGVYHLPRARVYTSSEAHNCIDKSVDQLGLGMDNLIKIPVTDSFKINVVVLEAKIKEDITLGYKPFCIIGTAGTVNTGAVDDLQELADIAEKYGLWFHVDGAYGGLLNSLDEYKAIYKGLDRADTIAVDFHKWLYQQFEVGCCLAKNWDSLKRTFSKNADYLSSDKLDDGRIDFNTHAFQLSRNAKALKVFMSFKTYGAEKIRSAIRNDIANTQYLADLIDRHAKFELVVQPTTGIVCFRYIGDHDEKFKIDDLNRKIIPALESDGRVFITGTIIYNRPVIRACLINHRHKPGHLDYLITVIENVAESLLNKNSSNNK